MNTGKVEKGECVGKIMLEEERKVSILFVTLFPVIEEDEMLTTQNMSDVGEENLDKDQQLMD